MLMIDVRNAISSILDRYTLDQVVEVTLRKMRRDGITPPFAQLVQAPATSSPAKPKADPDDGFLAELSQLTGSHDSS